MSRARDILKQENIGLKNHIQRGNFNWDRRGDDGYCRRWAEIHGWVYSRLRDTIDRAEKYLVKTGRGRFYNA